MLKLGLVTRIILIVAVALFAIQLCAFLAMGLRSPARLRQELSPALQVVSTVRLLNSVAPETQDQAVRALKAGGLDLRLVDVSAPDESGGPPDSGFARKLARDFAGMALGERYFRLRSLPERPRRWFSVGSAERTVEVSVGIAGGRVAIFDLPETPTVRLSGLPIGFMAGLLGVLVAVTAIVAVARETRPLTRLARIVNSLGTGIQPFDIPEEGACELRALIRAINGMQLRIAALINSRTLILGAISHDLRTYLTRFRLRMEMMPETPHRERAIADVEAMQRLVEDALGFARSTVISGEREIMDLDDGVRAVLGARHDDPSLITLGLSGAALQVAISQTALRRVLDNLVDNAIRYGGRADISVARRGGSAVITVADRGEGIPPEKRSQVLEPFTRLEESRNRDLGGSGLGLTIVRQILDSHNGTLSLEDRPGGGLSAVVSLPVASGDRAAA